MDRTVPMVDVFQVICSNSASASLFEFQLSIALGFRQTTDRGHCGTAHDLPKDLASAPAHRHVVRTYISIQMCPGAAVSVVGAVGAVADSEMEAVRGMHSSKRTANLHPALICFVRIAQYIYVVVSQR